MYENKVTRPAQGAMAGNAIEPRNPAVPRTLDSLHGSIDGLAQDLGQFADRIQSILGSPRPQEVERGSDKQPSTGCHVSDMIHSADNKVEALRNLINDLTARLQV